MMIARAMFNSCSRMAFTVAIASAAPIELAADTVSAGGSLYENVQVQTIRAGKLFYLDSAGNLLQAPVEAIERVRFEGLTELEDAQRLMSKKQWEQALPKLLVGMSKAKGDAQELWLHAKLAETHGALGDFIEAAGHAAAVLDIDPVPVWLSLVPSGDMNEPTFYSTGEADYFLKRARRKATDAEVVAALDALIAQIEPIADEIAREDARRYRPGSTISGILIREIARPLPPREPGAGGGDASESTTDAGERMDGPQPPSSSELTGPQSPAAIDGLLEDGEFVAALAICQRVAENPGQRDLAQLLYQYGRALAGSTREADAAVRFMQCAIEFPSTSYAIRSIMETSAIYREFYQKPDTADRLLLLAVAMAEEQGDAAAAELARAMLAGDLSETGSGN